MSHSFCREYEEFKAYRNTKRHEWFHASKGDWKDGSESTKRKSTSSRRTPVTNKAGQYGVEAGIDSFSTPPSSDNEEGGEENAAVVHPRLYAVQTIHDDNNSDEHCYSPEAKKRRLSSMSKALAADRPPGDSVTGHHNPTAHQAKRKPNRRHARGKSTPRVDFEECTPVDDVIDWSDSQASSQSQDTISIVPVSTTLQSHLKHTHRPRQSADRKSKRSSRLPPAQATASWKEAFFPTACAGTGDGSSVADRESDTGIGGGESESKDQVGINDFDSDFESVDLALGQSSQSESRLPMPADTGDEHDVGTHTAAVGGMAASVVAARKGSNWIEKIRPVGELADCDASLLDDTLVADALAKEGLSSNASQVIRAKHSGAKRAGFVRGGYAELLSNLLGKRQTELSQCQYQLQNGLLQNMDHLVVEVLVMSASSSGFKWAYCKHISGRIASPVPSSRDGSPIARSTNMAEIGGDHPNRSLLVLALPVTLCRRLSVTTGVQLRVFRPWNVFNLRDFCPPILLSTEVCEVVSPPILVESRRDDRRLAALASAGLCPYHPHEPCSKQLASDGEALEGQVNTSLVHAPRGLVSGQQPAMLSDSTSNRPPAVGNVDAAIDPAHHSDGQHVYEVGGAGGLLSLWRTAPPPHWHVMSAIEAAGGCGPAIDGGVAPIGRVQLVHPFSSTANQFSLVRHGRSLLDIRCQQLSRSATSRTGRVTKWLLLCQDAAGACFQVQIGDASVPMEHADPTELLGEVVEFSDLQLLERVSLKRSPSLLSLLNVFSSTCLPRPTFSQADSEDWVQDRSVLGATFYSLHSVPGKLAVLNVLTDTEERACSHVRQHPTCTPTLSTFLHDNVNWTRWSFYARFIARCVDGQRHVLVLSVFVPGDGNSQPRDQPAMCHSTTDGSCPGMQRGCFAADESCDSSSSPRSMVVHVSIRPSCVLPMLLMTPSCADVAVLVKNLLVTSHSTVEHSVTEATLTADMYTSVSVVWPAKAQAKTTHVSPADIDLFKTLVSSPCTYPISTDIQSMNFIQVSGEVLDVEKSTAFSWSACTVCGADVEETSDGIPVSLYCRHCGAVLDEATVKPYMQLNVFLLWTSRETDSQASPSAKYKLLVRLGQESISAILPPLTDSQNPDVGYDFSLMIGKHLPIMTCIITSVTVEAVDLIFVRAREMPKA
eukprot:scpid27379/ scgid1622/ Uncharacterized protein KIAA0146